MSGDIDLAAKMVHSYCGAVLRLLRAGRSKKEAGWTRTFRLPFPGQPDK
ncbi:hypothetical protein ACWAT4_01050 [Bradyrhizobium manausense]